MILEINPIEIKQTNSMQIELKNVMPKPLASIQHGEKSIWGSHVILHPAKKIVLNASSGKGKSTFASTVFGIRDDYSGRIEYDKRDIKTFSVDEWTEIRKNKIAVVFQDLQLFLTLSVRENLLLKNSLSDTFTEGELKTLLEKLEIDDKWNQKCGLLSMGQQQRVAIIRSLAQPFDWLLMDEPFSHLDIENTNRCLSIIADRTNGQNAGFVITTLGNHHSFNFDQELNL
ncbi:ATP-binding cassette domain-containing protein [Crocinitomicaceae bacterium]|nr:ATP-binding cassette domain-containing protein [Crocinitomicaceae bacterium]